MESYIEMKNRHQQEFDNFPCFFAFNMSQFNEGMKKLGLEPDETDKIYKSTVGMFYRRSDSARLRELLAKADKELSEALEDESFFRSALQYELDNHEYSITCDPEPALDALCLSLDSMSEMQLKIMNEIRQSC